MAEAFLSFEVDGELLHIYVNSAGLERLLTTLQRLSDAAKVGLNEDAHFFAESWGGHDLNELPLVPGARTIKQVDFRVILDPASRAI
jgi:hypothetical protein